MISSLPFKILQVSLIGLAMLSSVSLICAAEPTADQLTFFEKKIRPVLAEKCFRCHSAESEKLKAGLQVDHREHFLTGGDSGPSIDLEKPQSSLLLEVLQYGNPDMQMPPKGKLDDAVISDFEKWVSMGAPWPKEPVPNRAAGSTKTDGGGVVMEAFDLEKRRAEHWSWQSIANPEPPAVSDPEWPLAGIDHFVLAKLDARNLKPAESAAPETWLRRVSFDLVGLPPAVEDLEKFLVAHNADPEKAMTDKVDDLLASPHFGEKWARHWMDLARFGETCGHEFDYPIPEAWRYRDYLINAFNRDVPYDQILTEHLAGDLLKNPRRHPDTGLNESITGTGYWFLHEAVHAPTDIRGDEADRVDNQVDVFGKTFLGQALGCARCHDHKFDAISTADYYAMTAFLQSSRRQEAFLNDLELNAAADRARENWRRANALTSKAFGPAPPDAAREFSAYLLTAQKLIAENAKLPVEVEETVFADFENGYGDWKIEGKAFGKNPATGAFAPNQKLSGFAGKGLVNTWIKTDQLTGRALSPEFTIEKPFIHFLIAGGNHQKQTCVNLLVGGKSVLSATGQNNDQLKPHTWEVRKFRGKKAQIEIVDKATGGWGHIDLDHIVFSDEKAFSLGSGEAAPINRKLAARIAVEAKLSADHLVRWTEVLRSEDAKKREHPLHAFQSKVDVPGIEAERKRFQAAREEMVSLADFKNGDADGWTSTGEAFTMTPTNAPMLSSAPGELLAPAGVMHSGLVSPKLQGVLRSPTFELTHDRIHLRMNAKNIQVRLVIDSHYMNHFHTLLLKGTILKNVDTGGQFAWQTMTGNLDKYIGHRVWIEIKDLGDGFAAIDEVLMSSGTNPPRDTRGQIVSPGDGKTLEDRAARFGKLWAESLAALAAGTPGPEQITLLNLVWGNDLMPEKSEALLAANQDRTRLSLPRPVLAPAMLDGTPENARIHIRGTHKKLGEEVARRNLTALGGQVAPEDSSGRLELARQLTAADNPLVRRVAVNRVWHHLFGRGLVPSVDDFGKMGIPPSHPLLLDHLATRFSDDQNWSVKALLKSIVLSRTYRMSSVPHPANDPARLAEVDPENILLHRAPVRRLQAEAIRDAMLAISGRLDPKIGGPSVKIHLTSFMEGRGRPGGGNGPLDGDGRRSLYTEIRRNFLPPFLLAFDQPSPFNAMGRRSVSNVPAQALALMNDPFVIEQAKLWAEQIGKDASLSGEQKVERLFQSAYARKPTASESKQLGAYLNSESDSNQAWVDLCHALFNKKEFIYLN